jgi:hypothetical protein
VIELDTEGQYEWKGVGLAEAVFRIAESMHRREEARKWLQAHGLILGELGELGSTTQFLPSIKDLHDRFNCEFLGRPRALIPSSKEPADSRDLFTWLLRPSEEVCKVIAILLNLPAEARPSEFWVWCDGESRSWESLSVLTKARMAEPTG